MYYELAKIGAKATGEEGPWPYKIENPESLIALAADMSRYDPRLLSILVEYLTQHWQDFNPCLLRTLMLTMDSPQTLLVVLHFVQWEIHQPEARYFYEYLASGYHPVSTQLYFKNLYPPASHSMIRASEEPVQEFLDWGFLARERPILYDKNRKTLGHWGPQARQNIILRLLQKKESFTLAEYLNCVDHTISRQQALTDLKSFSKIIMKGKGRNAVWEKKSQPK